jgi:hypothetical protein
LLDQTIDVLGVDMGMTANDAMGLACLEDGVHRLDDNWMIILPWKSEILGKVAFADDDQRHSRDLLENTRQVFQRLYALAHHADEDFSFRIDWPHIGARVIFLLGQPPVARRSGGRVAALACRLEYRAERGRGYRHAVTALRASSTVLTCGHTMP